MGKFANCVAKNCSAVAILLGRYKYILRHALSRYIPTSYVTSPHSLPQYFTFFNGASLIEPSEEFPILPN